MPEYHFHSLLQSQKSNVWILRPKNPPVSESSRAECSSEALSSIGAGRKCYSFIMHKYHIL
jgi:hypothetical protein